MVYLHNYKCKVTDWGLFFYLYKIKDFLYKKKLEVVNNCLQDVHAEFTDLYLHTCAHHCRVLIILLL